MSDDEPDSVLFGRIVIERRATDDGTAWDDVTTEDEFGDPLDLSIALGLIELAKWRLVATEETDEVREDEG